VKHPAFLVLLIVLVSNGRASDWPEFLGPNRDCTSAETGLLDKWPTNGPSILWEKEIGTGYSAPSVRGNTLVLFHRTKDEEIVEALTADKGAPLWRYATPTAYRDPYGYNNGPRCTPLLTTNRVFTFGVEGRLSCLDLATGKRLWERETAKDFNVPEAFFGVGSTPVLEGNLLITMIGAQTDSGVVAFDADTGKTVWQSVGRDNWQGQPMLGWPGERRVEWRDYDKQASYASPVLATIHGRRTVFCLMRQGLVSLNPTNGEVNFSRWFRARVDESVNAANPVVIGDEVLISAAYYKVGSVLLQVRPDGKGFDENWNSTSLEIHWSTPVIRDGYLYAFSGRNEPDARFRCVEFKTGKVMWDRPENFGHGEDQPKFFGRGSAILADGKLIVLGEGGLLGLFRPNPEKPEEISRWQVPSLKHPCWAAPVLANKRLYLRSENRLVCLNLAAAK
jgi:outer membrane protein assembly factor BamB